MKFKLNPDNTKLILTESDKGEYNQLKLYLTRKVHNYRFMKRFKLGIWDGTISYFGNPPGNIDFGLWQEVYQCCKKYGYPFIIENKDKFPINKDVTKEKIQEFVDDFYKDHKTPDGKDFKPYDHQVDAIFQLLKYQYGLVEIATAGGKSLVFGTLLFYYLKNINPDAKFLLIVPNISLVTQFYNDLNDYNYGFNSSDNKEPLDIRIDEVMSDKPRKYRDDEKKPNIYIGTYQSLEKWPNEWFKQFDVVATDECLHPDTLISTICGKKKISEINIGDLVYTINEDNGEKEIKEVDFIYKNISKGQQMFEIEMENGEKIKITGNHKVILINKKRKRVDQLDENDEIFDFGL
jgi:hypothetical protein